MSDGSLRRFSAQSWRIPSKSVSHSSLMLWRCASSFSAIRLRLESEHLAEEAVEEDDVLGLVGDLRGEEDCASWVGAAIANGSSSTVTRSSPMKNCEKPNS